MGDFLFSASSAAGVAQLVEHFLAKEDVESSSLFTRSNPVSAGFVVDCGSRKGRFGKESHKNGHRFSLIFRGLQKFRNGRQTFQNRSISGHEVFKIQS
jgi:hypothetical protein